MSIENLNKQATQTITGINRREYLEPHYINQKSFYKKSYFIRRHYGVQTFIKELYSYQTKVARIYMSKTDATALHYEIYNNQSMTTRKHINEFLQQNGFKSKSKAELEELLTEDIGTIQGNLADRRLNNL